MSTPNIDRLKFIQAIIDRMARNSFALKGWAVTITGALISLAFAQHDRTIVAVSVYVVATMAMLDAYYLALERAYRHLYDSATTEPDIEWSLTAAKVTAGDVARAVMSPSILLLYGISLGVALAALAPV